MLNSLKETSMRDRQAKSSLREELKLKYLPGHFSWRGRLVAFGTILKT